MMDIVTVFHNKENYEQSFDLISALQRYEPDSFIMFLHSNMVNNKGFSRACNIEAAKGSSPIIGFLNPDVVVEGPFIDLVDRTLVGNVVITGCNFNKASHDLKIWGVKNWVCGATFFVKRDWFESLGGFDERFIWSHEETDFIRTTEKLGKLVQPISLPLLHASPDNDSERDMGYKEKYFREASLEYQRKWSRG